MKGRRAGTENPAGRNGLWDGAAPPKVDMTMHRFRRSLKHWWQRGRRLVRYNRQASAGLGEEPIKEVPADHRVGRMIISYFFQ